MIKKIWRQIWICRMGYVWFCFISIVWVHFWHNCEIVVLKVIEIHSYFLVKKCCEIWICPVKQCLIWFRLRCLSRILAKSWEIQIFRDFKLYWSSLILLNKGICCHMKLCLVSFVLFVFFGISIEIVSN